MNEKFLRKLVEDLVCKLGRSEFGVFQVIRVSWSARARYSSVAIGPSTGVNRGNRCRSGADRPWSVSCGRGFVVGRRTASSLGAHGSQLG